ncbi:MAG: hypothetical protein ACYSSI_08580 [Planctomycetota bacterium]
MKVLKNISIVLFSIIILNHLQAVEPNAKPNVQAEEITTMQCNQREKATSAQAVVHEKIQALGLRDDTLEYNEQPLRWLKQHREKILPQLIEGLDCKETRIALGCLKVLNGIIESEDFLNALIRIAGNNKHPINAEATLSLCPFAKDKRAKKILEKALVDTERFDNPKDRATIAQALDRKAEAVKLLVPFLESQTKENELISIIRWLGEIGHESSITPLKKRSHDLRWLIAKESYLAMAEIDPDRYGLTQEQKVFLVESARRYKENRSNRIERWKKLAELNKKEVRPFIMQMLVSDIPEAGLIVLEIWNDKEALPKIQRLMKEKKRWHRRAFIAAYLDIEGTDESIIDVISMTTKPGRVRSFDHFLAEDVVLAVTQSIMSDERKLTVLRRFRDELGPQVVAKNLRRGGGETAEILSSLMAEEANIPALGEYAKTAAMDGEKRFDKEVLTALEKLVSKDSLSSEEVYGAQLILDACAACKLTNSGKLADKLLSPFSTMSIRIAAARVSAILGGNRSKALKVLYEGLNNSNPQVRKQASGCLVSVECLNNTERAEREQIVLSYLGHPTEDYALRILTTCAGKKTTEQLSPVLDEENVPRAVYAAWVLAQHPDETIRQKALRRVAVYAMFNHQIYQAGAGIDFAVAPNLSFHQVTENLNRRSGQQKPEPVHIPEALLAPFEFNIYEQAFAVRAYRYSRLNILFDVFPPYYLQRQRGVSWNASHLPLFRVIAREDPHLRILYVKGNKVAHFKNRKDAAEMIAGITGVKASYIGLAGEEIDSEQVPPRPYKNQNKLITKHILDQIEAVGILKQPEGNIRYNRREALMRMIRYLTEELGKNLEDELIAESHRRNIALELKNAHFSLWRNVTE